MRYFLGLFLLLFAFLYFFIIEKEAEKNIVVAACPTFYYLLDEVKKEKNIKTVKTKSTSETTKLLKNGDVHFGISGRPPKEGEEIIFEVIGEGYDFISKEDLIIGEKNMEFFSFYTDLEKNSILENFAYISEEKLKKVENIDKYIEKEIVITFLDRPMKEKNVHIFKENGERVRLSRKPRLYYLPQTETEKVEKIKEVLLKK